MSTEPKNTAPAEGTTGPRRPRPSVTREECGLPKDLPAGIPMEWVYLERHMPLPGDSNAQHINASKPKPNGARWEIELIDRIRHYRVTFYPADDNAPPETELIPESRVMRSKPLRSATTPAAKK